MKCRQEIQHCHEVLVMFIDRYTCFKSGGELLPSLIELYQWIHTDLAHVITREKASSISCSKAVEEAASNYPEDIEKHYNKLYEKVQGLLHALTI